MRCRTRGARARSHAGTRRWRGRGPRPGSARRRPARPPARTAPGAPPSRGARSRAALSTSHTSVTGARVTWRTRRTRAAFFRPPPAPPAAPRPLAPCGPARAPSRGCAAQPPAARSPARPRRQPPPPPRRPAPAAASTAAGASGRSPARGSAPRPLPRPLSPGRHAYRGGGGRAIVARPRRGQAPASADFLRFRATARQP